MPDTPRSQQPHAPDARPDPHPATEQPGQPPASAEPSAPSDARTPDDYMEEPGRHRRGDGAATDVGA